MVILGIDPGLASTGFGAIRCDGPRPLLLKCGLIRTSSRDHVSHRLSQIYDDMNALISTVGPDTVAMENVFSLVRYPRAGILLGGVLGVIYLNVFKNGLPIIEVTPREVKNALVGYGAATKKQVQETTSRLLRVGDVASLHASDALAVALTVFYRKGRGY